MYIPILKHTSETTRLYFFKVTFFKGHLSLPFPLLCVLLQKILYTFKETFKVLSHIIRVSSSITAQFIFLKKSVSKKESENIKISPFFCLVRILFDEEVKRSEGKNKHEIIIPSRNLLQECKDSSTSNQ